jgi:endonuclease-3
MPRLLKSKEIDALFRIFSSRIPEPKTELVYSNTYQLLVAVVLSAQSTDASVNKALKPLFDTLFTPEQMLALGEEKFKDAIKTIGLYKNKAKNVIALSRLLMECHNGDVPHTREALEALPGVGRKTANVILNVAFGEPTMAVDTHIFRVSNRLGLVKAKNVLECEHQLLKKIPKAYRTYAHHWLILHGRYVCKARSPLCGECPVLDICLYGDKRLPALSI